MRIIKEVKLPEEPVEKKIEYHKCTSILAYTKKDIFTGQYESSYVVCPVCKSYIDV